MKSRWSKSFNIHNIVCAHFQYEGQQGGEEMNYVPDAAILWVNFELSKSQSQI